MLLGLDLSDKMLAKAREKTSKKMYDSIFKKGDAEDPPFEAGTFDVVVPVTYCGLFRTLILQSRTWKKVLKKGGVLIVIDGLYNGGLIERKTRQLISDFLTLLVERRYPRRRQYPNEVKNELPNPNGVPPEKTY